MAKKKNRDLWLTVYFPDPELKVWLMANYKAKGYASAGEMIRELLAKERG